MSQEQQWQERAEKVGCVVDRAGDHVGYWLIDAFGSFLSRLRLAPQPISINRPAGEDTGDEPCESETSDNDQ